MDLTRYRDMPITGSALTAIEAAVALGSRDSTLLDRAPQQRVDFDWVYHAYTRNLGRHMPSPTADAIANGRRHILRQLSRNVSPRMPTVATLWHGQR